MKNFIRRVAEKLSSRWGFKHTPAEHVRVHLHRARLKMARERDAQHFFVAQMALLVSAITLMGWLVAYIANSYSELKDEIHEVRGRIINLEYRNDTPVEAGWEDNQ